MGAMPRYVTITKRGWRCQRDSDRPPSCKVFLPNRINRKALPQSSAPALSTAYSVGTPQNRKNRRQSHRIAEQKTAPAFAQSFIFSMSYDQHPSQNRKNRKNRKNRTEYLPESQNRQNRYKVF